MIKRFKARRWNIGHVFPVYINTGDLSDISSNCFSEPIDKDCIHVHGTGGAETVGPGWYFPDWLRCYVPLILKSPFSLCLSPPPPLFSWQLLPSSARDHKTQLAPGLLPLHWLFVKQPAGALKINYLFFLYHAHCGLYTQKQVSEEVLKQHRTRVSCLFSEAFPDSCHGQFI